MVEESFQLENIKYYIINTLITDLIIILKTNLYFISAELMYMLKAYQV